MLGYIILGVLVLIFILMFTKPGVLLKGMWGLLFKNIAQTPDGAEAIYQEAIEKTQDKYNEASNALQKIAGQLETAHNNFNNTKKRLKDCEEKCENLVAAGKTEQAILFAEERESILTEYENYKTTIEELQPMRIEAEHILQFQEKELRRLKLEQKTVVGNLRRNIQVKEMYDTMDNLKRNSNLDKMMGHVKDGAQEKREMATGAKVLHESKLSTKLEKANVEATKLNSNSYLESLKTKYKK